MNVGRVEKTTKPAAGLRPPSFRTTIHRPLDPSDPKRPPSFETGCRETPLDRPGVLVRASDRTYVTTPEGSIRLAQGRRRPAKPEPETPQQAKARERVEAALQKRDRRRVERLERHLAKGLKRTKKIAETVHTLTGKKYTAAIIDDPYTEAGRL